MYLNILHLFRKIIFPILKCFVQDKYDQYKIKASVQISAKTHIP